MVAIAFTLPFPLRGKARPKKPVCSRLVLLADRNRALGHDSGMERDDTAAEHPPAYLREPGSRQESGEVLGPREAPDARRQVRVGGAAREQLPEERDGGGEPDAEERRERSPRPGDLEAGEAPTRAEDAAKLPEARLEVGDVPDAEADGGRVERRVRGGKREHGTPHPLHLPAPLPCPPHP